MDHCKKDKFNKSVIRKEATMHTEVAKTLTKQSVTVLKDQKRLLVFTILSTLLTVGALYTAAPPLFAIEDVVIKAPAHVPLHLFAIIFGILMTLFFVLNLLALFACSGVVACALEHLSGKPYTLTTGFSAMARHAWKICVWQIVGSIYGPVLKFLLYWVDDIEKKPGVEKLLKGLSWNVATLFIIPVMLTTPDSTPTIITTSATLIHNAWGETGKTLKFRANINRKMIWLRILLFIPVVLVVVMSHGAFSVLAIGVITACIFIFLLTNVISISVHMITTTALFLYANGVDTSRYYDQTVLQAAFYTTRKKIYE
jgi:hypothetical protein